MSIADPQSLSISAGPDVVRKTTLYAIRKLNKRRNTVSGSNRTNDGSRDVGNDVAEPWDHQLERIESFAIESSLTNFLPELLDGVELSKHIDSMGYIQLH